MTDWKREIRGRLQNLRLDPRREDAIVEELAQHLDDCHAELLSGGASETEAYRQTLTELSESEILARELRRLERRTAPEPLVLGTNRRTHMVADLWQDLRYGARMLKKNPGFTLIAALSLALGIGANTAIFSVVDAMLLKMLPVREPERLVMFKALVNSDFRYGGYNGNSYPDPETGLEAATSLTYQSYVRLREQSARIPGVLSDVFAFSVFGANVIVDGQPESLRGQIVSGNYYAGLGVKPLLGRLITDEDDNVSASPAAVLSHRFWQRRFGGDPAAIGKQINVNSLSFTVIGVTPPGFEGTGQVGSAPELTVPLAFETQLNPQRSRMVGAGYWWLRVMGRLAPGATAEQARAQFESVFQQSVVEHREARRRTRPDLLPLEPKDYPRLAIVSGSQGEMDMRRGYAPQLYLLAGVVSLVLAVACANVANLLLARAASRRKEIAVRLSMGASRFRLIRQLLTESVLLAALGGALGVVLALWIKNVLLSVSSWGGEGLSGLEPSLDLRVFGFTLALSLATGLLFGSAPAWRATRLDLATSLKESGRASSGISRSLLGKSLVVAQVAISMVLLIGAGLFVRTLRNLQSVDAGFNRENLLTFSVDPAQLGYQGERLMHLYRQIFERLDAIAGARAVTSSGETLLTGSSSGMDIYLDGASFAFGPNNQPLPSGETRWLVVRENFLAVMGIPLLAGRTLSAQDDERAPRVAVVNQAFVKRFFPHENPLGRRFGSSAERANQIEIVGIAADAKYTSLREENKPNIYLPWAQELRYSSRMTFALRTADDPMGIVSAAREAVRSVDGNLPLNEIKTQAALAEESLRVEKFFARLLTFFGALSLLLAAIGLYGVLAYSVAQRTQEIGIRVALGAQTEDVLRLVVGQGIRLAVAGVALGAAGAAGLTQFLRKMLYGVSATDPATFAIIALVLLAVASLACWVPARRAARVDPLVALRCE